MASGCITDDISDCPGILYVDFEYTYNPENVNYLQDQVEHINLYFYDENYKLVMTEDIDVGDLDSNGGIYLEVPPGRHTIVAWGNTDEINFEITDQEDFEAFRLTTLKDEDDYISDIPLLFYGITTAAIKKTENIRCEIPLVKNTNSIHIGVVDATNSDKNLPAEQAPQLNTDLKVRLEACNWQYTNLNVISPEAQGSTVEYKPVNSTNRSNDLYTDFNILRMFSDNSCHLEVIVEDIRNEEVQPVMRFWLTEKILTTEPLVNNDEDLLRFYDYEVKIEVAFENNTWTVVRVWINEWEMEESFGGI